MPPPETPTTPQPPGQNAASPSRVAASLKRVAKMFAVAEEQPGFGGNYCKARTVKKVMSGKRKTHSQGHADRHGKYEVIREDLSKSKPMSAYLCSWYLSAGFSSSIHEQLDSGPPFPPWPGPPSHLGLTRVRQGI